MLGLLHVELVDRVGRDHDHVLLVHGEPQRAVEGLGIGAVDYDVVAQVGEHELLEVNDLDTLAAQVERASGTAAGEHERVGGCLGNRVGRDLGVGHDGDASKLELLLEIGVELVEVLVRALHGAGEGKHAAQDARLLVQCDGVAAKSRDAGGLHAGGAAADDHDVLGGRGGLKLVGVRAVLGHDALGERVDAAVAQGAVHLVGADVAVQAARAGRNLVDAALAQLVDVIEVNGERAGHHVEVDLAVGQGLLEELGGMGGIVVGHAAAGDGQGLLVALDHADEHAGALVGTVEVALPVLGEVVLGAEARGTLNAVEQEVQVAAELAGVVAERAQAQVYRVGAGLLHALGHGDALFHRRDLVAGVGHHVVGGHERGAVVEVVVVLDAVDEDLHDEVVTGGRLDLLDALAHPARTVLGRGEAVLVGASVVEAREELLALVEAGGVDLDALEAHLLELGGVRSGDVLHGLDLLDGHGVLGHARAEEGPLIAQVRAVLGAGLHEALAEVESVGAEGAVLAQSEGLALDPDHLDAALGEVDVVVKQLVGVTGQVGGRTGGRLHHAVRQLDVAQLPGGEQRGEVGLGAEPVAVLGVDGSRVEKLVGSLGALSLSVGLLGLGLLGDGAACHERAGGCGAGTGKERATRNRAVHACLPCVSFAPTVGCVSKASMARTKRDCHCLGKGEVGSQLHMARVRQAIYLV